MEHMPEANRPCELDGCNSYEYGHLVHFIQARFVGESPWGWRDAVVIAVEGLTIHLEYVGHAAKPVCWHHKPLDAILETGSPVRLHEQYNVLGCPAGWFGVQIDGGLGPVPVPDNLSAWAAQRSPGVVNLGTGTAVATDHAEPR